ncbi:DUF4194 domain-containing protein [Fodinisporobacter ferrooxydans]|uniref:DUF4194 domain-containing protein n=1 Tax=Fodinisporobacter ferrooxydans TaxID=2901836 RepID=A0ABY4CL43_9BACL|nr:DUF4194 domain-containing protein [Alicyclobacillaceae bacterium MYW30-H2]
MDWQREYEALSDRDREQFSRLLSILFDQTFLVRDVWDAKEGRLTGSREYRFAERVKPMLDAYLSVSGWALQVDSLRGVMALYNRFGRNRKNADKLTTYILYVLRLIYDEQLEQVSGRREIVIWLRDVYEKLRAFGFIEKKLAVTRLQAAFMKLRKLSIMERIDGEGFQPDSRWIVYPTIRMLVSDERISQLYEMLDQGKFDDPEEELMDLEEDLDVEVQDRIASIDEKEGEME